MSSGLEGKDKSLITTRMLQQILNDAIRDAGGPSNFLHEHGLSSVMCCTYIVDNINERTASALGYRRVIMWMPIDDPESLGM